MTFKPSQPGRDGLVAIAKTGYRTLAANVRPVLEWPFAYADDEYHDRDLVLCFSFNFSDHD